MRRGVVSIIVLLAACGPIQSAQVQDQIRGLIGLSQERILSCMGPPSSTGHVGSTDVWSYDSVAGVRTTALVTGDQSFAVGTADTTRDFCHINVTIQNGWVVAANYRSQGKLLSPSLPCYPVLQACVPNPSAVAPNNPSTANNRVKEASDYCKELYKDPRLDPLRGVVALDEPPTLEMQSNSAFVTAEQKNALNAFQPLHAQCRDKVRSTSPQLAQLLDQIGSSDGDLLNLYQRKMTIGDFNRARAEKIEKLKAMAAKLTPASSITSAQPSVAPSTTLPSSQPSSQAPDYCQGKNVQACWQH